jgi:hypothetical protein
MFSSSNGSKKPVQQVGQTTFEVDRNRSDSVVFYRR